MESSRICVVGLGYVGLPLAVELSKYMPVTGFDINPDRIAILQNGKDPNGEVSDSDLAASPLSFSANPEIIGDADIIIVAVPTPIDRHKQPDLTPLLGASRTVGENMRSGAIIVFESTVYPGATEEECVPVIEQASGMRWKDDFFVGYSPERINPGDKVHTFATITKVISGDTRETLDTIAAVYEQAVTAGVHRASCIRVAEAAKVIENTQRDINIALMNELRIIFDKLGISTREVLEAAGTKWNFLKFEPGLVGGHCIGVDPYYLAHKAESVGHHPQIIMAGRRINDAMGRYFARQVVKQLIKNKIELSRARVLVLGFTFKENVPDIRNSRVIDIVNELTEFNLACDVWDPVADGDEIAREYGISLIDTPSHGDYDAVILAVKHARFFSAGVDGLRAFCKDGGVFFDIKEAMS
jgi:UDP-N-acetyl-D-galactosamine dehydrogenase